VTQYRRWNALLDMVAVNGHVTVGEAARTLRVSSATIRRDLEQLAEQQMVVRTRGGAVANSVSYDLPLRYKTARHAVEKQRIGRAAAKLVAPGATVALNGGTTVSEVARALATRADMQHTSNAPALTMVTNALNIASEMAVRQHVKIVLTGGVARGQSYELIGPLANLVLAELTFDWAILGVDALDAVSGASAKNEGEASINQIMADRASQVVIVADSSKLGQRAFARICPPERIDVLVTDSDVAETAVARFAERGIRVILA
jgi:DeoR family transcriptional regulator, aga operon transcriptional repressor